MTGKWGCADSGPELERSLVLVSLVLTCDSLQPAEIDRLAAQTCAKIALSVALGRSAAEALAVSG